MMEVNEKKNFVVCRPQSKGQFTPSEREGHNIGNKWVVFWWLARVILVVAFGFLSPNF